MHLSSRLKEPMRAWLLDGILTNTNNTRNQLKPSFIRLLKHSKSYPTETKDPTMMNYSTTSTHLWMPTQLLRVSSMSMELLMRQNKSSSMSITLIPSTTTIKCLAWQNQLPWMILRQLIENFPSNTILRPTKEMNKPTKSLSKWMRHTMPYAVNSRDKIMIIWFSERWFLWELIISLMTSLVTDGYHLMRMNSNPFSRTNGLKALTSFGMKSWMKKILRKARLLRLLQSIPIKMENKQEKLSLLRRLSKTVK